MIKILQHRMLGYLIIALMWSIADGVPMSRAIPQGFSKSRVDRQLRQIVQDLAQNHDNSNPMQNWEEVTTTVPIPCSSAEVISGVNNDYYLQYMDDGENWDTDYLDNIEQVDVREPRLYGCRPVIYCADIRYERQVPVRRHWVELSNKNEDCFMLTQNGRSPYPGYRTNNPHKDTDIVEATKSATSTKQIGQKKTSLYGIDNARYDPRRINIAVHNNIHMGGNEKIFNPTFNNNISQVSNSQIEATTDDILGMARSTNDDTLVGQSANSSTTSAPNTATVVMLGAPNSSDKIKNCSNVQQMVQSEYLNDKDRSHINFLLDFLNSFRKQLCGNPDSLSDSILGATQAPIQNEGRSVAAAVSDNMTSSTNPSSSDVIFVIQKNQTQASSTSSKPYVTRKPPVKRAKRPTKVPSSVARGLNILGSARAVDGSAGDVKNQRPKDSFQPALRINSNNYSSRLVPQKLSVLPPRTFYLKKRKYGRVGDNQQKNLENCEPESMLKSQLDSVECESKVAEGSMKIKHNGEYVRRNFPYLFHSNIRRST